MDLLDDFGDVVTYVAKHLERTLGTLVHSVHFLGNP